MKMESISICVLAATCMSATADCVLSQGRTEVVIASNACNVVRYAAKTLSESLEKTLGGPVPVVNSFTDGKTALVLGSNDWSISTGLDTTTLKRDGFFIRTVRDRVYLAGRDDVTANMEVVADRARGSPMFERGTYNAVLGFLERYAGWRFYFPGELGTIAPRCDKVSVPDTDLRDEPYFKVRYWSYWGMGKWHEDIPDAEWARIKTMEQINLRMDTERIPVAHGQSKLAYPERFAKTHPEFFALDKDGKRLSGSAFSRGATYRAAQFCYTSGVWEELYKDARSFFLHEDASERGIVASNGKGYRWNQVGAATRKYFDIMPQDGLIRCQCENCAKLPQRKDGQWASEVIWENTVNIANRLKSEGIEGTLVQMAYGAYRRMPDVEIPDNIAVMLAERGPWSMKMPDKLASDMKEVNAWSYKLHARLWLWNYAGKFSCFGFNLPDIPQWAPRSVGAYYKLVKDKVFGAYLETETDLFLFDYLNLYVFSRVMWDPSVDVEALLAEHDRLMFGAGADEMGQFFRILEDVWLTKIAGKTVDTPRGPQPLVPSEFELWTRIYSPECLERIDALFNSAMAKTNGDGMSQKRIALMRKVIYGRFWRKARTYQDRSDPKVWLARETAYPERNLLPDDPSLWYRGAEKIDTETFLTPPHSFRLDGEKGAVLFYVFDNQSGKPMLKPNMRYRFSYYLKLRDLQPLNRGGGAGSDVTTDHSRREGRFFYPAGSAPFGTQDWFRQEFEFRTFDTIPTNKPFAALSIRLRHVKGTAWYDEIHVEEIGPVPLQSGSRADGIEPPRIYTGEKTKNIRDLGGWKASGGRVVRTGRIIRSAAFNESADAQGSPGPGNMSNVDRRLFCETLGVRTDLDLRSDREVGRMTSSPLGDNVRLAHIPGRGYGDITKPEAKAAFRRAFAVLADAKNYPVAIHCVGGADRTGTLAILLNGLLGVSPEDLRTDWQQTAASLPDWPGMFAYGFDDTLAALKTFPGSSLSAKIESFVLSCGVSRKEIEAYRTIMLDR